MRVQLQISLFWNVQEVYQIRSKAFGTVPINVVDFTQNAPVDNARFARPH
jgi:hypothetical protein